MNFDAEFITVCYALVSTTEKFLLWSCWRLVDNDQFKETHAHKVLPIYFRLPSLVFDTVNLKLFIYLGRRPSHSPLFSSDILVDIDVVALKLSN
jgi:hypothetical protein